MRRLPTGGTDALVQLSLLPFLDIIFGTIGIFVVAFALQNIVEVEDGVRPSVDCIVTCLDGGRLTAHWPDGTQGPVAVPERSLELLQALGGDGRSFRSMILAIGGDCFSARQAFMEGFEQYLEVSRNAGAASGPEDVDLMLELYPVGGEAHAASLLEEWRTGGNP